MSQGRHTGKIVFDLGGGFGGGTVLLTGGTGGVGAQVARHLVREHGVRSMVLAGRRGPAAEEAPELLAELTAAGAAVRIVACDVADRDAVAGLLADLPPARPLTAVVHAAGVLADGTVASLTPRDLDRALRAKALGALHLHELTRDHHLSAFVLFSALAGTLGTAGQAGYAAANAFLDALAARRRAAGLVGTSLCWGWWEQRSGMTAHLGEADRARVARLGVAEMPTAEALALFDAARALDRPVVIPARLDLAALRGRAAGDLPPLLRDLAGPARPARAGADPAGPGGLPAGAAGLPDAEAETVVGDWVRDQVAVVLGHPSAAAVDADHAFTDLGFDSLTSVELCNRLAAATGLRLPSTLVFSYPTPRELAAHLLDLLRPGPAGDTDPVADAEIREALRTVPLDALREAGLLEPLLACAGRGDHPASRPRAGGDGLAGLDLDALVDLALDERSG